MNYENGKNLKINFNLDDIYIGKADGESESTNSKFMDMFYTGNNKVKELIDKSKFIISGRKGTGKTVLARYFLKKESSERKLLCSEYTKLKDISLHELIEFGDKIIDRKMMYNFQKFYIYKEFVETLLKSKKKLRDFDFCVLCYLKYKVKYRNLKKFYSGVYTDEPYEIIKTENDYSVSSEVEGSIKKQIGARLSEVSSVKQVTQIKEFYKLVSLFETKILDILKYVEIILVIDDFDDYFIDDKQELIRFFIDFISNVKDINNIINNEKLKGDNRCIILMRDDVIDSFSNHDANIEKTTFDCQVHLNWMEGKNQTELKNMICNKILFSNKKFEGNNINDIELLFFPKIDSKISKKSKKPKTFFNQIMEMTFGRPRDVIVMFNIMVSHNRDEEKFAFSMIKEAALEYSRHFIKELRNEMQFHFTPDYIDAMFKLLADYKMTKFTYEGILEFYNENGSNYKFDKELKYVLNDLYKFGVIGYAVINGKRGKIGYYAWSYYSNASKDINLDSRLIIHKGLHKGLNI